MLSRKAAGCHPTFGTIYFWALLVVAGSATVLSIFRWSEDYYFAILGVTAYAAAFSVDRSRQRWPYWARLHMSGMGMSYIVLLTAFYVDNGKSLPFWKDLLDLPLVHPWRRRTARSRLRTLAASIGARWGHESVRPALIC